MKVYTCNSRFFCTPLKRYIPEGALIYRYENVAKLAILNAPDTAQDPFTTVVSDVEYDDPSQVTWFWTVEGTSGFTLSSTFAEDAAGGAIAASKPKMGYVWEVATMNAVQNDVPGVSTNSADNFRYNVNRFDDTLQEFTGAQRQTPPDLDPDGEVDFLAVVRAVNAGSSDNVKLTVRLKNLADGGHLFLAFATSYSIDDQPIADSPLVGTNIEWSVPVATLGLLASQQLFIDISREEATTDNLVGDMDWLTFGMWLPRI